MNKCRSFIFFVLSLYISSISFVIHTRNLKALTMEISLKLSGSSVKSITLLSSTLIIVNDFTYSYECLFMALSRNITKHLKTLKLQQEISTNIGSECMFLLRSNSVIVWTITQSTNCDTNRNIVKRTISYFVIKSRS